MGQSTYNLWKCLREFLGVLTAVGTGQDRNPPISSSPHVTHKEQFSSLTSFEYDGHLI